MILTGKLSCLWTLILFLVASDSSPNLPSITDQNFIDQCVRIHNELRSKVSPPAADMKYVTWEAGLAKVAKAWADKCKFEHNSCLPKPNGCHPKFKYIGENIWIGSLRIFSPKAAVSSWYNETRFYDFDNISCSSVCGHYTQVVWATSKEIGCGISLCPNLGQYEMSKFVCNYAPTGNYPKVHPYTKGTPCSKCEGNETCVNNLCGGTAANSEFAYQNSASQNSASQNSPSQNSPSQNSPSQNSASQWIVYTAMFLIYNLLRVF